MHIHGWIQALSLVQLPLAGIALALGVEQWAAARGAANHTGRWIAVTSYLVAFVLTTNFLVLSLWHNTVVDVLVQLRAAGNGALFVASIALALSTLDRVSPALHVGAIATEILILARTGLFLFTDLIYRHSVANGWPQYTRWLGPSAVIVLAPIAVGVVVIARRTRSSRDRLVLLAGIGGSVAFSVIGVIAAPPARGTPGTELLAGLLALPMLAGLIAVARIDERRSWRVLQRVNKEQASLVGLLQGSLDLARLARFTVDTERRTITLSPEFAALLGLGNEEVTCGLDEYRDRFYPPAGAEATLRAIDEANASGAASSGEAQLIRADGTLMWTRGWSEAVDATTRHGVVQDITEQKLAEIELRESAATLKAALDLARLSTFEVDLVRGVNRLSPELSAMLGIGEGHLEMPTRKFREHFYHPDDRRTAEAAAAAYEPGRPADMQLRFIGDDGETRWLRAGAVPVGEDLMFGVVQDVTEYKHTEAELREAAATLKAAVDVVGLATYELDVERKTIRMSPEMSAMFGAGDVGLEISLAEFRERFHHPEEDEARASADAAYAKHGPLFLESRIVRGDGVVRWIRTRSVPAGETITRGVIQDITSEKLANIALRDTAATLKGAVDLAGLATFTIDTASQTIRLSPEMAEMYGADQLEYPLGPYRRRFFHPDEHDEVVAEIERMRRAGEVMRTEGRIVRGDGRVIWSRGVSTSVDGHIHGVVQDITQQKLAEIDLREAAAALAESEGRFRRLAENSPDVIIRLVGTERRTEYISPAVERILRRTPEDFYSDGHAFAKMLDPLDIPARDRLFETPEPRSAILRVHPEPDSTVWLDVHMVPVFEGGVVVAHEGTIRDVSDAIAAQRALEEAFERLRAIDAERRQLLEHLLHAQEEERRVIAQGIHDDSVQELVANAMQLERLAGRLSDPALKAELEGLTTTARGVIGRLRTLLFRLDPPILRREGLSAALHESLLLFGEEIGAEVEFESDVTVEPTPERASLAFRIAQEAFANIRKHAQASHVAVRLEAGAEVVRMTISDDGEGFDAETWTPAAGHMGLASIEQRARVVGGWSRVESAPGIGTVVEVALPAETPTEPVPVTRSTTA